MNCYVQDRIDNSEQIKDLKPGTHKVHFVRNDVRVADGEMFVVRLWALDIEELTDAQG